MKLTLLGVGQAGGKIVDAFLEHEADTGGNTVSAVTAFNTAEVDLRGLERVPPERRVLIGESRVRGHGVGADNDLGAEIASQERPEILNALHDVPVASTDAFLVVAALGGGTGSGAAPVIARQLAEVYSIPVYGLGVLPASDEGGIYALNAARSFRTFVNEVDNLLLFDNEAWRQNGASIQEGYDAINREIARRFGLLFSAGEVRDGDTIGESVVDSSEIINTLAAGGVSTLGYAAESVDTGNHSLVNRLLGRNGEREESQSTTTSRTTGLVRQATRGRLTLPCAVESADRGLLLLSGPPDALDRKGLEQARRWLEDESATVEVRGGDYPRPRSDRVAAAVLLSNVTEVPRIEELQAVATETQEDMTARERQRDQDLADLVRDEDDELDPLY